MLLRLLSGFALAAVIGSTADAQPDEAFVYLGDRPVFFRVRVAVDGRSFREPFVAWLKEEFTRCDANGDGSLSADEASNLPSVDLLRSAESPTGGRAASKQDADGNGQVSLDEFVSHVESEAGPALIVRLAGEQGTQNLASGQFRGLVLDGEQTFRQLDRDGNRKLSPDELAAAATVLRKFDRDDDDSVSLQELQSANPYQMTVRSSRGLIPARSTVPVLHLNHQDVSARAVRAFFKHYDRAQGSDLPDLQLSRQELPIAEAEFAARDANRDQHLDFDEVRDLLQQFTPQIELTVHVADQWERTPAIEVICQDAALQSSIRKSITGEATLALGTSQFEVALPAANAFNATTFLLQQFKQVDRDNNGYLESQEVQAVTYMSQVFRMADANADDKLFHDELSAFLKLRERAGSSRIVVDLIDAGRNLFEILDANRDRRLGPGELRSLPDRTRDWDSDGDQNVGADEVPRHFRLLVRRGSTAIPGLNLGFSAAPVVNSQPAAAVSPNSPLWFRKMDRNADGEVSRREFIGPEVLFERLDANNNGSLDTTEAAAVK